MRRVIAHEDHLYPDGRMLAKGAVVIDKDTVPVVDSRSGEQVGYAHSFERDEDTGEITMFIETEVDIENWCIGAHLTPYQSEVVNDIEVTTHGHLKLVYSHLSYDPTMN